MTNHCCLACRRSRLEPYTNALGYLCIGIACSVRPGPHFCGTQVISELVEDSLSQCYTDSCLTPEEPYCHRSSCPDFSSPPSLGDNT
jgi:hypothetical protein